MTEAPSRSVNDAPVMDSRLAARNALSPRVAVIVLNYRRPHQTLACLASLEQLAYPNYEVIVVDNDSQDDSVERIRASGFAGSLIQARENRGFSAGNNLGIEMALNRQVDYVWLLNNDAIAEPGALSHLVAEAEKTGGLAGSLLLYPDRRYQQAGIALDWLTGGARGVPETAIRDGMPMAAVSGASLLIPAKALQRIGLLDERYFLYFEDVEYCLRASRKRYPVTLAIRSRVFHEEGATTGKRSAASRYYFQRNRLKAMMAYASPLSRLSIFAYALFRAIRSQLKAMDGDPDHRLDARLYAWALRDFLFGVNGPCPRPLPSS